MPFQGMGMAQRKNSRIPLCSLNYHRLISSVPFSITFESI